VLAEDELRGQQRIPPLGLPGGQRGETQTFGAALGGLFRRQAHALQRRVDVGVQTIHRGFRHIVVTTPHDKYRRWPSLVRVGLTRLVRKR